MKWLIRGYWVVTAAFILCYGSFLVLPKAYWLDEWFLMANVKLHPTWFLLGKLDYSQQFPRIYLILIKKLCEILRFSETSYRLLPYLAGALAYGIMLPVFRRAFHKFDSKVMIGAALEFPRFRRTV